MVGISLLTLVPGVVGGTETYAREICRALHEHGGLDYTAFVPSLARDAAGPMRTDVVEAYPASARTLGRLTATVRARYLPSETRRHVEAADVQVVHFPLTTQIPRIRSIPTVVTVHDLQHLVMPAFFSRVERLYRRAVYAPSIKQAQAVVAISEYVKDTIVDQLEVPADRITVSHFGVDHSTFKPEPSQRPSDTDAPFVLYPANAWPHKNHGRLLVAFEQVRQERPELRLVLTGAGHQRAEKHDGVEIRGHVHRSELVRLYQTASALVFPSLYEGFGQPPLEAMACGCPVACSNAAALPEVCGDAVRYFDPRDPHEIALSIDDVLRNAGGFRRRGIAQAETFTWEAAARLHDDTYRRATDGWASSSRSRRG